MHFSTHRKQKIPKQDDHNKFKSILTPCDYSTSYYVRNSKAVATTIRKFTYPDGNRNMGASNGPIRYLAARHHGLIT